MDIIKRFILIEDSTQLEIFFKKYLNTYIPIVYDVYCQVLLERKRQRFLTINNDLSFNEVIEIYHKAWDVGESLVEKLDKQNEELFYKIFGFRNIKLFRILTKYLLTYNLVSNVFHAMVGLWRILDKNKPCSLFYFPFDIEKTIFSSSKNTDYFCPKRILPFFISIFKNSNIDCVALKDRISSEKKYSIKNLRSKLKILLKALILKYIIKKVELPEDNGDRRNILVISSGYNLRPVLKNLLPNNKILKKIYIDGFHIISESHNKVTAVPESILNKSIVNNKRKIDDMGLKIDLNNYLSDVIGLQNIVGCNLQKEIIEKILIILEKFIQNNFQNIITEWDKVKRLDSIYKFKSLLWDNPPVINVDRAVISEYFGVNNKHRIGIQHGGAYGCKYYGHAHFDSDYNNCEYYYGYGYSNKEIEKIFPDKKIIAKILTKTNKSEMPAKKKCSSLKEKVKVVYIFPYNLEYPFFQLARPNRIDEYLFEFQKKIVKKLFEHNTEKIILKFPPNNISNHALKIFVDGLKHSFIIETKPLSDVLEKYFAEYILIDVISTPLEQSLSYDSKLLLYNYPSAPLTDDAFKLLSKRAVIASDEDQFLSYIDSIFTNTFPKRDISNNEYGEKYAKIPVFNSNSGDNSDILELFALTNNFKNDLLKTNAD